jgi:membrane protein
VRRLDRADVVAWWRGLLRRLISLEVIDRSLVVGAQAFSALVPLLIVVAGAWAGGGESFADRLIDRFDLEGDTAEAVRDAFGGTTGGSTLTVVGVVIVFFSALSFTRAMQRTFELTWNLPKRGIQGTGWGIAWLAAFAAYLTLVPVVRGIFHGWPYNIISLAGSAALWLGTPYILLARRIAWRRLIPQALLTSVGMTLLGGGLLIYAPRALETSSEQFGAIGVAFTLLTILWAAGFVLVTAAGVGAYITTPTWSASPGSATQRSSPTSAARGS